jgi:predicted ester cyclase
MANENLAVARRWLQTYADGDAEAFLACMLYGWVMHEAAGETSTAADLADITRLHAIAFPAKKIEYVHELADGDRVAQAVILTVIHSGRYFDLEPTGRSLRFDEMVFHRFEDGRIAESWRLTHPGSVYELIAGRPRGK